MMHEYVEIRPFEIKTEYDTVTKSVVWELSTGSGQQRERITMFPEDIDRLRAALTAMESVYRPEDSS